MSKHPQSREHKQDYCPWPWPVPANRKLSNMYRVADPNRIREFADFVEYLKAEVQTLAQGFCKTGLLIRTKEEEPAVSAYYPELPTHLEIADQRYKVRLPATHGEAQALVWLWQLEDKRRIAEEHWRRGNSTGVFRECVEIGKQIQRIRGFLKFDEDVGRGRRRVKIETDWVRAMADARRLPDDRRQTILAKLKKGMSYQAIARDLKCSKKTVAQVKQDAIQAGELTA